MYGRISIIFMLLLGADLVVPKVTDIVTLTPEILQECMDATGATQEDVERLKPHVIPQTRTGWCLMACAEIKLGFMNSDYTFNLKKGLDLLDSMHVPGTPNDLIAKVKGIFANCAHHEKFTEKPNRDECEMAKGFTLCVESEKKKAGLDFWP